jgi:glycosyltransferase involved in cell wall biosynthesis
MEQKISALILTKNSEDLIEKCIKSVVNSMSEVIVVDAGSTDATKKIAERLGAKFVNVEFKNFADQRNFASTLAGSPWIFYIDSDEQASEKFLSELKTKIHNASQDIAGFWIRRKTYYFGREWRVTDRVQRVFRKARLKKWYGDVHESAEVEGKLGEITEPVLHDTHRNFEQMVEKTNEWSDMEANLRLKSGHPKMNIWRFFRVMTTGFLASYFKGGGWKNGTAGVVEGVYQAFSMFITYAKLWEKQEKSL